MTSLLRSGSWVRVLLGTRWVCDHGVCGVAQTEVRQDSAPRADDFAARDDRDRGSGQLLAAGSARSEPRADEIKTHGESADQLVVAHLVAEGVTAVGDITRDQVSDFITRLLATRSPSTASVRFRALQQFFSWLVDEEEIEVSPMAKLRPPKIPEQLTPVQDDVAIRALLKACASKDFRAVRDTAIVRLFLDTGMRLDELAKLRVEDVELDSDNTATVLGKGRRPGVCPFGATTAQALDRYLRQHSRQKRAEVPEFLAG